MENPFPVQTPDNFLVNLEKISVLLLELLKQATLRGLPISSLAAVKQVWEFFSANTLPLPIQHETSYQEQSTQTEPAKCDAIVQPVQNSTQEAQKVKECGHEQAGDDKSGKIHGPGITTSMSTSKLTDVLIKTSPRSPTKKQPKSQGEKGATRKVHHISNTVKKGRQIPVKNKNSSSTEPNKRKFNFAPHDDHLSTKRQRQQIQENDSSTEMSKTKDLPRSQHRMLKCENPVKASRTKELLTDPEFDKKFLNKGKLFSLTEHHHATEKSTMCNFCCQIFPDLSTLRKHRREMHGFKEGVSITALLLCNLCGLTCREPEKMSLHIKFHLQPPVSLTGRDRKNQPAFECQVCGKLLATLPALLAHKKRHQSASKFHCDFCSEDFTNIQQLKSHRQKHFTEDKPYKCPICAKGFRTPTTLRTHKMLHTGEQPYKCDICGKRFIQTSGLNAHKLKHTAEEEAVSKGKRARPEENPLSCDICGRIYKTRLRLEEHMKSHDKASDLRCQFCSKMFTSAREAAIHKRTHFDGKLSCKVCGKAFKSRSEHYFHTKSHGPVERPHLCSKCGKSFITLTDLKVHLKRHELGQCQKKAQDPFVCTVCGKMYVGRSSLTVHMKVHAGVFDLPCDLCPKKFKTPAELRHHRRVHTNEKPYVCDICNRAFSRHSTLANHKRSHRDERPFLCVVCGAAFKLMNTLKKHSKIHNKDHNPKEKLKKAAVKSKALMGKQGTDLVVLQNTEFKPPLAISHPGGTKQILPGKETNEPDLASALPDPDELVPPPPPYPTYCLRATVSNQDTNETNQTSLFSEAQETFDQKFQVTQVQPQPPGQLSEQTRRLLGLQESPAQRPTLTHVSQAGERLIRSTSNPLLSFSGQIPQQPRQQTFTMTVRQPQQLVRSAAPSQQISALGLLQSAAGQTGQMKPLVRTAFPRALTTSLLHRPTAQTHPLLQLPARLHLTAQRPLVTAMTQGSIQPYQPDSGSIDQPLFRLQNQFTSQPAPTVAVHQDVLRQHLQALVTPANANLLLRPVELLQEEDNTYEPQSQTSTQEQSLGNRIHILQTPPTPSSPAAFPSAHSGQTLVLLSTAQPATTQGLLSIPDDNDDPISMQPPGGIAEENTLEEDEDEEEDEEMDDSDNRDSTPNLLDLTNTTTYTYYYC